MTSEFADCSPNHPPSFTRRDQAGDMATTVLRGIRLIDGLTDTIRDSAIAFDASGVIALDDAVDGVLHDTDDAVVLDLDGMLVAPGLIDLHGDAFERSLMPRGGVFAPIDMAMQDNRAQLAASGISTSYLSATDSWEPGLRSRDTLRSIVEHLDAPAPGPQVLLHVRRETTSTDGFDELSDWLRSRAVRMISFADHTPGGISPAGAKPSSTQLARSGLDESTMTSLIDTAVTRRAVGASQDQALTWLAAEHQCPTASHDGNSLDDVQRDSRLGVTIAEFPTSVEIAKAYRHEGMTVLFGAPNLVRGGSHLGNLSVADALCPETNDVLCSDYHYPSLLQAPFSAEAQGLCSLATAWKMVSSSAATAAGLHDRGTLEAGRRADIVVIDDRGGHPRAVQLFVDGQRVYQVV